MFAECECPAMIHLLKKNRVNGLLRLTEHGYFGLRLAGFEAVGLLVACLAIGGDFLVGAFLGAGLAALFPGAFSTLLVGDFVGVLLAAFSDAFSGAFAAGFAGGFAGG